MSPMMRKTLAAYAAAGGQLPPLVAVVRLHEKALVHAHQARAAAAERRYDQHWRSVERATAILAGLDSLLDMAKGGEVAQVLRGFHRMTIHRLGAASARKDPVKAMDVVIVQMTIMARTWRAIAAEQGKAGSDAESGRSGVAFGASAKESHASVIGRSMDHAHGSVFG
ncbi:flagellar protein FliS [bacterium]|nr:flagellar protein FliS [bacterium]